MAQQTILRSFLKRLVNLTRRRVSHQAGLIRQAAGLKNYQALSLLSVSVMIGWFSEMFQWHSLTFRSNTPKTIIQCPHKI